MAVLFRELVSCENEIAFSSAGYSDAVELYNTRISTLPDLLLEKLGRFKEMPLLQFVLDRLEIPELVQEHWRREHHGDTSEQEDPEDGWHDEPLPEPTEQIGGQELSDAKVFLLASLIEHGSDVELIRSYDQELAKSVEQVRASSPSNLDFGCLQLARGKMKSIRAMTAEEYREFRSLCRRIIESDDRITYFEYAIEGGFGEARSAGL